MKKVVRVADRADGTKGYMIFCPACEEGHALNDTWGFNGNFEKPTFSPSLLVRGVDIEGKPKSCHSYIRDGVMEYLSDCTHSMAGQSVTLKPF